MENWMIETDDYLLPAFRQKNDPQALNRFMEEEIAQANQRAASLNWKRWKNSAGKTGQNKALYQVD